MFTDRRQAGQTLAERLRDLRHSDAVVLGLPAAASPSPPSWLRNSNCRSM
ncbi:hypothetical protein ACRAWC_16755 [Leifsonia sp. L25]